MNPGTTNRPAGTAHVAMADRIGSLPDCTLPSSAIVELKNNLRSRSRRDGDGERGGEKGRYFQMQASSEERERLVSGARCCAAVLRARADNQGSRRGKRAAGSGQTMRAWGFDLARKVKVKKA